MCSRLPFFFHPLFLLLAQPQSKSKQRSLSPNNAVQKTKQPQKTADRRPTADDRRPQTTDRSQRLLCDFPLKWQAWPVVSTEILCPRLKNYSQAVAAATRKTGQLSGRRCSARRTTARQTAHWTCLLCGLLQSWFSCCCRWKVSHHCQMAQERLEYIARGWTQPKHLALKHSTVRLDSGMCQRSPPLQLRLMLLCNHCRMFRAQACCSPSPWC